MSQGFSVLYLGADVGAEAARRVFGAKAEVVHVPAEPAAVAQALAASHGLLDASMKTRITDAMVAAAPHLAVISCATTGSDHIERNELERRGIPVHTLREDRELLQNLTPAAELTWALFMALARNIPGALAHVRQDGWTRELFPGVMFNGKRLGVIGCGRIGGWVGRYARAFGMDVVGYDPLVDPFPEHIRRVGLDELAATSDFISIHVHLSEATRGLMSRELFARVKPGAFFVNTSRGGVADEEALLAALQEGRLAGAGLDVLSHEPDIAASPLLAYAKTHDNLIITPHCGGFSPDAVALVCARAAEKIAARLGL